MMVHTQERKVHRFTREGGTCPLKEVHERGGTAIGCVTTCYCTIYSYVAVVRQSLESW